MNGFVVLGGEDRDVGWMVIWENSIMRGIMGGGATGVVALSGVVVDAAL